MSDLISKKALVKAILAERDKHPLEVEERYSFGVKVPCKFNQALRGGIRKCLHLIETAPTVDAVEVVYGHWIDAYPEIEPNPMFAYCICSVCGFEQSISNKLPYCPYCGAKIGEEDYNG